MNKRLAKLLLILGLPTLALAQLNTFTTTTLSAAVAAPTGSAGVTFITVASATGINAPAVATSQFGSTQGTAGSALYVDNELFQVVSVSGTTIGVQRGTGGTRAQAHPSGRLVWIGNPDWYDTAPVGTRMDGTCTKASLYAYPDIHILDGTIWACSTEGVWGAAGSGLAQYGAGNVRTTVADAAYTALVYDSVIAYTSLSATRAVTLPAASSMPGKIYVIVDESGSAGTDNITVAGASNHCTSITANYGQTMCRSNGTAWFTF